MRFCLNVLFKDRADNTIRTNVKKLIMEIPFVSSNYVEDLSDNKVENVDDGLTNLSLYIENTYIRRTAAKGKRRVVPLRFSHQIWNVYGLIISWTQKIINSIEG